MRASSAANPGDAGEQARTAGRDALSLALIDARNRTLRWLARFETTGRLFGGGEPGDPVPLHGAGRVGWLQEWWIARNVHRLRAAHAGPGGLRLPGIEPAFDGIFGLPDCAAPLQALPAADEVRRYLLATLEQTLDLLAACPPDDEALAVYRYVLQLEDRLCEAFAVAAQRLGVAPGDAASPQGAAPARPAREPLWMPAQRFTVGNAGAGWVPAAERGGHAESVPDFEIDAQAVSWERFVEFVEDGGYDREALWQPSSWQWLQAQQRRAPRYVEQLRGGVLATRFGVTQRVPGAQAATHLSWHEADAWCRWAGRRLPTEPEWELAACTARSRGFVWGDVWEWVAGTARPWPGGPALPTAAVPPRRVLRGASSWTPQRAVHVRQRRFVAAERDELFCGFRSCAA